jgi:parallel beta-helix repeat protein
MSIKHISTAIIMSLLLCGVPFVALVVHADTSVSSTISQSTTWTLANSPYSLTQNITVNSGVTLTIEPGVNVNMPSNCILEVNGKLVAEGGSSQKINMQGGEIHFGESSSGSTIKNARLDSTNLVVSSSVQISGNTIIGRGSSTSFEAILITAGSPIISDNSIFGAASQRGIRITGGSPTISNNGIMGMIISEEANGAPVISRNTIEGGVLFSLGGTPTVSGNLITGFEYANYNGDIDALINRTSNEYLSSGIVFVGDYSNALHDAVVTDNVILGSLDGISVLEGGTTIIQRNLIVNTTREALHVASDAIIRDNTIRNNVRGIVVSNAPNVTVNNNNIENNGKYNFYLYTGKNIDASNNWWGTTDTQVIENSIYDNTFEPYDGSVHINPILTAPNQAAHPNSMSFPYLNMPTSDGTESNPFQIGTNSTVTDIFFNPDNTTLSFTVSGPSGTAGSANVTIAKSVMPNGGALKVYLDDKQISYALGDGGDSWNLMFAYIHSTHRVTITDAANQPQTTPSPASTPITPTPASTPIDEYKVTAIAIAVIALVGISLLIVFLKKQKT